MAITVKHLKTSAIPDAGDATLVQPSDWNADHTLTGTVPVANGGTGASTANDGFNALAPSQTGNSGKYLTTNGTDSSWSVNPLGTVTSVAATAGTGISVTGSPITTSGTLNITNTAPDQTVSIASGTGISATGTYPAFTVTNTAPDQVVALTAGTGISTTGTYPNFTITNTSPSLGGDVVGPASATDNAIARYDSTTGKLLQNSVVTVGDTGATTGITTLSASTSVTTPIVQASNSGGLALKNSGGTTQMSVGAGAGDNMSINVSTNINGTNAQIDISPTGTGHLHMKPTGTGSIEIAPTNAGTMNNMVIGGTTPLAITGTTITATSFVGSGASLTNVVNSLAASTGISVSGATGAVTVTNSLPDQTVVLTAGTGISTSGTYPNFTVTNTSPSSGGTVTSVTGTSPVVSSGGNTPAISMPAATTSVNGYLTSTDWTTFNGKISSQWTTTGSDIYYNTGNVGIGTSSPFSTAGYKSLTINGTTGGFFSMQTNGTDAFYLYPDGSAVNIKAVTNVPMTFSTNNTERMRITSAGDVGIGTTSPSTKLNIADSGSGVALQFNGYTGGQNIQAKIECERPNFNNFESQLRFYTHNGSSLTERMRIDESGIVTMSAYGAGAATFSASGVISSVSDETWKTKDGVPTNPDAMLQKLEAGYWFYNEEKAPIFGKERQLGFYAQNVHEAIGEEAAPTPEEGKPWGYYDRSVLAITVMSLKNALNNIEELKQRIIVLENK